MFFFREIKALGTEIEIYLQSKETKNFELDFVEMVKIITDFEQAFSRFKDDSEISQLNSANDTFVASSELINMLLLAKKYNQITEGIFDPTILQSLESLGYKKSFPFTDSNDTSQERSEINFQRVIIDEDNKTISKPAGLKIDLGGIGKGFLVDKLVAVIKEKGYESFWISAGGDMYLRGLTETNEAHQVAVQNPLELNKDITHIQVPESGIAVATSGIAKRQWTKNGRTYHHLIDPRTGLSTDNNLLAVTITADSVVKADIFAKTVFILGQIRGLDFINEHDGVEGLMINKGGEIIMSEGMHNQIIEEA